MKTVSRSPSLFLGDSEVFKYVVAMLFSMVLFGCATTGTKQILDNESVSSIKPGKTTRTEVEALFGKPYWVSTYEVLAGPEEEEWNYNVVREKISGWILVPLVLGPPIALIAAGAAKYATSSGDEFYVLSIRFSKEGIVKQVEKCKTTGHGDRQKCESY